MASGDYRVADISLADFGRKEIELAEHEVRFLFVFRHNKLNRWTDAWIDGL
jgi:adenosylhomocysteinase